MDSQQLGKNYWYAILAVGLSAFLIIRNDWVCRQIMQQFDKAEGVGRPEYEKTKWEDAAKFKKKHLPFFKKRLALAEVAKVVQFEKTQPYFMYERMVNLYGNSPLEDTPQYQKALFEKGRCLQRIYDYDAARAAFENYLTSFPEGIYAADSKEALRLLNAGASRNLDAPGGL